MNRSALKQSNAAPWIALLVISAVGETVALVFAAIFGVAAFEQADPTERARLWGSAGWWLLGMFACTAVTAWSLFRLLRIVGRQAPGAPTG